MTNEQLTALIIAILVGLVPNAIIKLLEKYKSKEEVADIEVDTLTETLKSMRDHNDFLEKKLTSKREEITVQNKMMYDINSQNSELTAQNLQLTERINIMSTQLLDITNKLQDCINCMNKLKEEGK